VVNPKRDHETITANVDTLAANSVIGVSMDRTTAIGAHPHRPFSAISATADSQATPDYAT
jgi:hypothetical protein